MPATNERWTPPEMGVRKAAERLREAGFAMSEAKLKRGIMAGVYPFGDYIPRDGKLLKNDCYTIYTVQLEAWICERSVHQ